ncbi:MAG: RDD family protein [Flavobacteriales bacterium CG_4_10_14_0_2_um_filter_32_8]|nr:MAG: RDD family protein [Flavobacteriales bacterium CG_4_10_14_0_2_um_filter_32_8]PJB14744.1 MAG: RDD family protein [Flavobacteriales bacterium CG_4_9_14_3_um_filter_32_8]
MNTIEITTTQNVTIEHELSPLIYRMVAFLLDLIILVVGCSILALVVEGIFGKAADIVMYFTIVPILFFYSLAFEYFNNGQSIGKKALRLRVIKKDGGKVLFLDYAMRWVFRTIDIYGSFGSIASLGIMASSKNQRLGDFLANTVVVRVGKTERMQLNNLLRLNQLENYVPTYPQVINMNEEAMLIVKEVLHKNKTHNNYSHQKALDFLVEKIENELELKAPTDKIRFLNTLLKDYVVLTR